MGKWKQLVLECDFFGHSSLMRYKSEEGYRTLAGGFASIVLVIAIIIIFSSLILQTLQMKIIVSATSTIYYDDPQYSQLKASPANKYMFALGLTGINLNSSLRYFDIALNNRTYVTTNGITTKTTTSIPLSACNLSQWSNVSPSITNSYTSQRFDQWLCPPAGTVLPLEGKFSSDRFKLIQIIVSKCTPNNPSFPGTTCANSSQISSFLAANGQFTFNFYFINPVINGAEQEYLTYYLEDSNYFAFDTITGVSSNLFYSDYQIITDTNILPWPNNVAVGGCVAQMTGVAQSYQIQNTSNQYFKFYLRKSSNLVQYTRTFQKIDMTLSYIGGLFGTFVLCLLILKVYSKYSYQIDFGDQIFKQENGGTFGSENFNLVVFLGYMIFIFLGKLGVSVNWITMKKFHKCRVQCQKQLNLELLFKKIANFQQIAKIVLQEHHLRMLMMVPKPTIQEVRRNRKRYLLNSIVYHQLQGKSRQIYIQPDVYKKRLHQFLNQQNHKKVQDALSAEKMSDNSLHDLHDEMKASYQKMKNENEHDSPSSKKIMDRLSVNDIASALINFLQPTFSGPGQTYQLEQNNVVVPQSQVHKIDVEHIQNSYIDFDSPRLKSDLKMEESRGKAHVDTNLKINVLDLERFE